MQALFLFDDIKSAVWHQRIGDFDATVFLLIIFDNSDQRTGNRNRSAVEHVYVFVFTVIIFKPYIEAAGLIVGAVGGRGNFAPFPAVASGNPRFQVPLTVGGSAEVAGTGIDYTKRNA